MKNDEDILQALTTENNFVVWNVFSGWISCELHHIELMLSYERNHFFWTKCGVLFLLHDLVAFQETRDGILAIFCLFIALTCQVGVQM